MGPFTSTYFSYNNQRSFAAVFLFVEFVMLQRSFHSMANRFSDDPRVEGDSPIRLSSGELKFEDHARLSEIVVATLPDIW
jgi:hypothetical protein